MGSSEGRWWHLDRANLTATARRQDARQLLERRLDSGQSLDEKLTKTSIVEALIDVDLVNQVLRGLWTSGYTHLTLTKMPSEAPMSPYWPTRPSSLRLTFPW